MLLPHCKPCQFKQFRNTLKKSAKKLPILSCERKKKLRASSRSPWPPSPGETAQAAVATSSQSSTQEKEKEKHRRCSSQKTTRREEDDGKTPQESVIWM